MRKDNITAFRGKAHYLSNFYPYAPIFYRGIHFKSSEHFYVTCKTFDKQHQQMIINSPTPREAKNNGKLVTLRDDWEDVKLNIMRLALRLKFTQNPKLLYKLCNETNELIEFNQWHDNFWGDCTCKRCQKIIGLNWLGRLLMELKAQYK
jgi:ribA/ribD-fused uncharacterized protein